MMRFSKWMVAALCCVGVMAWPHVSAQERLTVFVSDFHMGLGRTASGSWHPYEDFRWPNALRGFLDAIDREGEERVDLVILGDFLEFWQQPDDIKCEGSGADTGCSVSELVMLAKRIVGAHKDDFEALRNFSQRGNNRLHIVPGNHDAALLMPAVREPVISALGGASERVSFVIDGFWRSDDGRIFAEHGQQIGSDVNRFEEWPTVATADGLRMIRPWGERFVQRLFNEQERQYPIIDNLNPETAGARYRMADRGIWGSAVDIAHFISFNIFETSLHQKGTTLNPNAEPQSFSFSRKAAIATGPKLFTQSLEPNDPMRKQIEDNDVEAASVRSELQSLVETLPDAELQMLCMNVFAYTGNYPCSLSSLSAIFKEALIPRQEIFRQHLVVRRKIASRFEIFVYGHTHRWESGWKVPISNEGPVTVFNSGAFQRLVNEAGFLSRASANKWSPAQALSRLTPEDLPPCYALVQVRIKAGAPEAKLRMWQMAESGSGRFREAGVEDCN